MKKLIGLFLALLLVASPGSITGATGAGNGNGKNPALSIDTEQVYPGMKKSYAQGYLPTIAGGKAEIVLPLIAEAITGPLTVAVNLGDPANSPFIFKNYEKQFTKTENGTGTGTADRDCYLVQFSLELAKNRVNGHYPITLTAGGISDAHETFTREFTLYVQISDGRDPQADMPEPEPEPAVSPAGPPLMIDTRHVYPGMEKSYAEGYLPTVSGAKVDLVLPLLSETVSGALTCAVNLGDPAGAPFLYKNYERQFSQRENTFGRETMRYYPLRFSLELASNRINGHYPVTLAVSGTTDNGEPFSQEFTLYVQISDGRDAAEGEAGSSQPRLIVSGYTLEGGCLEAGGKTTLAVTVKNTGGGGGVKNIKFSFLEESGEILPAETGTVYCAQIAAGASYTWNLALTATTGAASRPHPALIGMEYEDHRGQPFSGNERIILTVRQPVRLEYEEPALPVRVTQGDTPTFTLTLMNLGKSVIYNALLKFEIPGLAGGGSTLVGTILPGESKTGTANFRVDKEITGDVTGTLTLSYEDDYGERYEKEFPLSTTIEEKLEAPPPAGRSDTSASAGYRRWLALAGGAALAASLCIAIRRWLKEKKTREEDEMRL